jgi:hypothetical protein
MLRDYDGVVSGSAATFVQEFHTQAQHRQSLERRVIESDIKKSERAQILSFAAFVSVVAGAVVLGFLGHEKSAIALTGMDIFGFGAAYVAGKFGRQDERREKAQRQQHPDQTPPG